MESTVEITRADAAVERVNKVLEKVTMSNRMLPEGMQPFQIALPQMEATAAVDALITTLVDAGIIDTQAFVDAKYERLAGLAEAAYEQVQKAKRDALGSLITRR